MSQSRQLAAIMFTDIVGYTALMGNDEQKAIELPSSPEFPFAHLYAAISIEK